MDCPEELFPIIFSSCRSSLPVTHSVVQYYNNFSEIRPFLYNFILSIFVLQLFQNKRFQSKGHLFFVHSDPPWRPLSPSEMAHTLCVECVSPWINLPSPYCGSLLNSFLHKAKTPHLAAAPGTRLRPGTWPSSRAALSFLQHLFWCPTWELKGHNLDPPIGLQLPLWRVAGTSPELCRFKEALRWWPTLPARSGRDKFSGREGALRGQGFSPLDLSHYPIALSLWTREDPPRRPPDIQIKTARGKSLTTWLGTKAPSQVEDGNFRLSTRFLEHCPVTSQPTNQRKATHPAALTPNFAYKNFSPKTIREFGVCEHAPLPVLFAWPCNKPFSAQKKKKLPLQGIGGVETLVRRR